MKGELDLSSTVVVKERIFEVYSECKRPLRVPNITMPVIQVSILATFSSLKFITQHFNYQQLQRRIGMGEGKVEEKLLKL